MFDIELTCVQPPANHSTLPAQGPLLQGVVSEGLLLPQPSRGKLLTWFVIQTTERVRTPSPHSAEHWGEKDRTRSLVHPPDRTMKRGEATIKKSK